MKPWSFAPLLDSLAFLLLVLDAFALEVFLLDGTYFPIVVMRGFPFGLLLDRASVFVSLELHGLGDMSLNLKLLQVLFQRPDAWNQNLELLLFLNLSIGDPPILISCAFLGDFLQQFLLQVMHNQLFFLAFQILGLFLHFVSGKLNLTEVLADFSILLAVFLEDGFFLNLLQAGLEGILERQRDALVLASDVERVLREGVF